MKKSSRLLIFVLACLAASNAPAQNPTPSQPPAYVDEAPLPKGWPKPGPYDQVSEKSYPSYRAAFTTENRENGAFQTLFSHLQKNDIPMTAPVEISMAEGDGQNLRQTSLAFLYQDTAVGKSGADGSKVEVRDVPAMKTLSYTWQGDRNEANIAKAKSALEAALKDRKIEAKGFRLLGYNGPGIPEIKRTWELQALLGASALATPATPPATPATLGSAAAPQPPTVDVEKQKLQPAAGEKFDPSEIRQALSELQALKKGGGSNQQIHEKKAAINAALKSGMKKDPEGVLNLLPELQLAAGEEVEPSEIREIRKALFGLLALKEGVGSNEQIQVKKAALKAAVERGIKQDPKSVLKLLFGFEQGSDGVVYGGQTNATRSFIQIAPELAITLLDQVPNEFGRSRLAKAIGSDWAESDQKAAFAWANQQTDPKIKSAILVGVISSWGKTDLKGALAYVETLPPGVLLDRDNTISEAFTKNCQAARGYQGALAMMRSLPEGRDKELAAEGISAYMASNDPRAAWDLASGIADSGLRPRAEQRVLIALRFGSLSADPDAATQWMQSLPEGDTKDMLSEIISGPMAQNHPQAAFDIAAGIGDSNRRTKAQKNVVEQWSKKDPAAVTQWIKSSALPQELKTQLLGLAASNAPAQNPTPSQPPAYVDEAPLPKGWPKPGPYDQVSEKSYPSYRAAFTTENRENGAFRTLFSHLQKNDIPMTAPVEISMAEGDGQNLRQTSLAFLYQDTAVGKTGADGAKIEVRDVPAMNTLSYTWQGDQNEANVAKAKSALDAALKDRKIEAKGFRLLGYNGPGTPELKRTWELQAVLSTSALATSPVPTSATPPSTPTTLGSAAAPQAPTVDVEKQKLQPAAGEKFDPSEIRQALSDKNPLDPKEFIRLKEKAKEEEAKEKADAFQILVRQSLSEPEERRALKAELQGPIDRALSELEALKKGGGSKKQIQKKIAALQAAIESGMKKDPIIALERLLGYRNRRVEYAPFESGLFVQSDPDFAIALLDQVPEKDRDFYVGKIAYAWAESAPQAVLAWANKQTAPEFKELILSAVIPFMARTDLQGTFAYIQSLPPGYFQDKLIRLAFSNGGDGALAKMHALPEGRTKDLAATGISLGMSKTDPQAAIDNASKIGDTGLRTEAEQDVALQWWRKDRTAAIQWMQSLPEGRTKDSAASGISQVIMYQKNDRKEAMDMASGIGDSNLRTEAQEKVVEYWFRNDPDAAIQWMQSLPEGRNKDIALNGILRGEYWLDKQACMDLALKIGDSNRRTQLLKHVAREWFLEAPAAATRWIKSSALPQKLKAELLAKTEMIPETETPLPRPSGSIVPPSRSR